MKLNTRTRALALLLALVMTLGLCPALAAEDGPVRIGSAEELAAFRDRVNAGENTLDAVLTADIALTGDWTPFEPASGYVTEAYAGTFDGGGHTVKGLKVTGSGSGGVGFFGTVYGATLQDLHLEGAVTASNSAFVGGLVGKTGGAVTIRNCSFSGSVSSSKTGSTAAVGGVVGRVNAGTVTLRDCANFAAVTGSVAGGVLGYCTSKNNVIENCSNTGTVTGSARTGGIAGQVSNTTSITNCASTQEPLTGFGGVITQPETPALPTVTTVEVSGTVAVGETVRAKIYVVGGQELDYDAFPVTVQWRYLTGADYAAGNTGSASYRDLSGATGLTYTIPPELEGDYLSFTLHYQGEDQVPGRPSLVLPSEQPEPVQPSPSPSPSPTPSLPVEAVQSALEWYTLRPVWGRDTNACRVLEDYLAAHDLPGFTAAVRQVEEVYGGGGVSETGDITYFYADPNTTPALHTANYKVTFALSREGEALDVEVPVVIPWDQTRVKAVLREEVAQKLTLDTAQPVTEDLSLPKVVDGKRWALVSWTSSDPDVISVSDQNQTTADTLFDPYVGLVKRGTADQNVTLTATVAFQFAGDDAPIFLTLTYPLTVRALEPTQEELIRAGLLAKLESGLAAAGVTDTVTGERLTPDAGGVYTATHDIQLPTTRDFGVDGKYYPVTVTTDCSALTAPDVSNAARVALLRPGVDLPDAAGTVTVTLHDRDTGVTAALSLPFRVPALTRSEVEAELALMDRVKAAYFEGLRGDNTSRDDIRFDLKPFFEVYEENGALVWVRSNAQRTGQGVAPIPMEGWEDLELWRLFRSSNPNVISHEDLRVTRQSEAKAVTVTSHLSSQTLGRYGQLYLSDPVQYAQYALLAPLYDQEVTTDLYPDPPVSLLSASPEPTAQTPSDTLVVRGTRDPESSVPVVETVDNVTFSLTGLDGQTWLPKTTFSQLPESSTVYDVFLQALGEDYTATRVKGTYIRAVSGPQGALTEQEHGENSGWMYRVNGLIPEVYMGGCPLHTGDVVEVFYTRDASQEVSTWTRPSTGNTSSVGSVRPQRPDTDPVSEPDQPLLPPSFTDVPADAWYASALAFVYDAGLMEGVSADRFAPDMPLTRGMLVSMLYRLNAPALKPSAPSFPDVAPDAWYAPGVAWAAEAGLVKGYDDGRFGPEDPITREQLATLLFRYAQHIGRNTAGRDSLTGFSDGDTVSAWAQDAMAWTVDSGVLTGLPGDVLAPAVTTTRAQAAAMLQRFCRSGG